MSETAQEREALFAGGICEPRFVVSLAARESGTGKFVRDGKVHVTADGHVNLTKGEAVRLANWIFENIEVESPLDLLPGTITCPECSRTSANPNDISQGYCGNCHRYTSAAQPAFIRKAVAEKYKPARMRDAYDNVGQPGYYWDPNFKDGDALRGERP